MKVAESLPDSAPPEQIFLQQLAPAYLAAAPHPCPRRVAAWRYAGLAPAISRLHRNVTGFRIRKDGGRGERLVWLEGGMPGDDVVLLHGFGSFKENWIPLLPFLRGRHRIVALDLPGWGQSHFDHRQSYGLDIQIDRVANWIEQHFTNPVHLVGSSMGGGLAGLLAARYPEQVRSLTLMNAMGMPGANESPYIRDLARGENGLLPFRSADVVRMMRQVVARRSIATALVPVMHRELLSRRHVNAHLFHQLLTAPPDFSLANFGDIRRPTLVLWGRQDRVLDVSSAGTFASRIPRSQVQILNGIGHLPMVEAPLATARILHRFWAGS